MAPRGFVVALDFFDVGLRHPQPLVPGLERLHQGTGARGEALWLHVENRPLDQDYRPQLPPSPDDPEGGWYWVVVGDYQSFPNAHHHWGDMLVVGRMTGLAPGKEPILKMVYVRGRGMQAAHDAVWEDFVDANYIPSLPPSIDRR